jgi:hypothetical protein
MGLNIFYYDGLQLHHGFDKSADLHPYFNKIGALYDILMTVI